MAILKTHTFSQRFLLAVVLVLHDVLKYWYSGCFCLQCVCVQFMYYFILKSVMKIKSPHLNLSTLDACVYQKEQVFNGCRQSSFHADCLKNMYQLPLLANPHSTLATPPPSTPHLPLHLLANNLLEPSMPAAHLCLPPQIELFDARRQSGTTQTRPTPLDTVYDFYFLLLKGRPTGLAEGLCPVAK